MTDWYRTAGWSPDDRAEFERRLARARANNRPQYLRIKAVHLEQVGRSDDAAVLYERVLRDYPASNDARFALERLGRIDAENGRLDEAEARFRQVLALPSVSGTSGLVDVWLAEVLTTRGAFGEAAELLAASWERAMLAVHAFVVAAAWARLAAAIGDDELRVTWARRALALVDEPVGGPLGQGLAGYATPERVAELRRLTGERRARWWRRRR